MGARKTGRSRFECLGKSYHWQFDDRRVRICSEDKTFVVAYDLGDPCGFEPHLEVRGSSFPGLDPTGPRPIRLRVPPFVTEEWQNSLGAFVNALIRWSLREDHELIRHEPANQL